MREECGPWVRQRPAAPEQGTGGAPVGGIDRGLREQVATEQGGNLVRSDRVVFGLAAMESLQREGMTEDERETCVNPAVGEPVPGAPTRDRHTPRPWRYGAMRGSKAAGVVGLVRCPSTAPRWSRMRTDMGRACRAMPQENGCWVV